MTGWNGSLRTNRSQALHATRALGWWLEDARASASVRVLRVGESELSYCYSVYEYRRVPLVLRGLREDCGFLDVVRRSTELVALGALPAPSTPVLKAAFFRRCSQVLQVFDPESKVDIRSLNPCDRRAVAVLLGAHVACAHCPAARADVMYEWDAGAGKWTRHGVVDTRGKFRPKCSEPPPREPEDEKWLCKACVKRGFWSCNRCRKLHCVPETMECPCGGWAKPPASWLQPLSPALLMRQMVDLYAEQARRNPEIEDPAYSEEELRESVLWPDPAYPDLDWQYHEHEVRLPSPVEMRGQKRLQ
jgi:hypothetical protein